ncbi:MAG: low specificity L-threonine aldolase [Rhizobiaceae bacterium]|nr:low specificity L-threonine aldolase [Rhizobiaceae bacterium]
MTSAPAHDRHFWFDFVSDNIGVVDPTVMNLLTEANTGTAKAYGEDQLTAKLQADFSKLFDRQVWVFPVSTGTAANSLGLSLLALPYSAILCHETAHVFNREAGAPEFFTGGAKIVPVGGNEGKIDPDAARARILELKSNQRSNTQPRVISLTQLSDWGTAYDLSELEQLAALAEECKLSVHMDGARFANAVSGLGVDPGKVIQAGRVSVLSFGGTKNGLMNVDAIVVFDAELAAEMRRRYRGTGQLLSKMRFASVQLSAYCEDDLWLKRAERANNAARQIASAFESVDGVRLAMPVHGNQVFPIISDDLETFLRSQGFLFSNWELGAKRFVCSAESRVETLLEALLQFRQVSQTGS